MHLVIWALCKHYKSLKFIISLFCIVWFLFLAFKMALVFIL